MTVTQRALLAMAILGLLVGGCSAQGITPDRFGDDVKIKILVDKVMQPEAGWHTEQWMVQETVDAGFNVLSPRRPNDLDEVRDVTTWCAEAGILHIPWMRGTLNVAPEDEAATGRRMVWANGLEDDLWSPNSDELWDWMTDLIVSYAQISVEQPALFGVFLDYENYAKGSNCYDLSYDDIIMGMFAEDQGIELPELELAQRATWIEEQGLSDEFEAFQVAHWRERCRALREAVDAVNRSFQFCIYPAPGTKFMIEAAFPEWTSEEAPVIFADAVTYGRQAAFLPQSAALEQNRRLLAANMATIEAMGLPFLYTGGIDPIVSGADPEFSGNNALMISEITDGYWIFYEGPTYDTTHPEYFRWFAWANAAMDAGEFAKQHEPRETPDPWAFATLGPDDDLGFGPDESCIGQEYELPEVRLRGRNMLMFLAKAGQTVEIEANPIGVGASEIDIAWEVRDLSWEIVSEGTIPFGAPGTISFSVPADGVYGLLGNSGRSAWALTRTNVPVGIYAGRTTHFLGGPSTLYFSVPEDAPAFSFDARGSGAETVRINAIAPSGEVIATGQTTPAENEVTVEVTPGDFAGDTWAVEITRADEGALDDVYFKMSEDIPPVLSLIPEHVFMER
jgi:hypothetical protein